MKKSIKKLLMVMMVFVCLMLTSGVVMAAESQGVLSESEAKEFVKSQIASRQTDITVKFITSEKVDLSAKSSEFIQYAEAYSESGKSYEGDAITYDLRSWSMQASRRISGGKYTNTIKYTLSYYMTPEQESAVRSAITSAVSYLNISNASELSKVRAIHDYVKNSVSYDYSYSTASYGAYSAVFNHRAVCQGYTAMFYRMCREAGLSVRTITGTANGGGHAWNIVRVDGSWYNIDVTWDSTLGADEYFLKNQADFSDHVRNAAFNTSEFNSQYPVSAASYAAAEALNGAVMVDGIVKYYTNGAVDTSVTGLVEYENGWYYIQNGIYNPAYVGLTEYYGNWYYVENGTINWIYVGLADYYGSWYYIQNGTINWAYVGLTDYYGCWFFVQDGMINWDYVGLVQYNEGWFFVQNGMIGWNYAGLVQYNGAWFFVRNGMIDWGYVGLTQYNGGWFFVQNGMIGWNYIGLTQYNGGWFFIQNGMINWGYAGLVEYNGSKFFVQNGMINWGYNGSAAYQGVTYQVVNGVAC